MQLDPNFDLLTYLPGPEFQSKIEPYQSDMLPFVSRMKELVDQCNPVANHQVFKDYTNVCKWPIRQMEYSFFIRHLPKTAEGLALDAGSGMTPFPYLLANKGWETFSTDIEADQMALLSAYGKEVYGTQATHLVDDLRQMHFPDQHFSLVTCVSVLEHLAHIDVPIALAELVRITKPGGRIIISTDVYPFDHPHIPPHHGAFTDYKIELIYSTLAKACGVWPSFVKLLNQMDELSMERLEKFWTEHWQPGSWEGNNRGYGAIGMVFDLPKDKEICANLVSEIREISQHRKLAVKESALSSHTERLTKICEERLQIINKLSAELAELRKNRSIQAKIFSKVENKLRAWLQK